MHLLLGSFGTISGFVQQKQNALSTAIKRLIKGLTATDVICI